MGRHWIVPKGQKIFARLHGVIYQFLLFLTLHKFVTSTNEYEQLVKIGISVYSKLEFTSASVRPLNRVLAELLVT
jgi:hypothetical protein